MNSSQRLLFCRSSLYTTVSNMCEELCGLLTDAAVEVC